MLMPSGVGVCLIFLSIFMRATPLSVPKKHHHDVPPHHTSETAEALPTSKARNAEMSRAMQVVSHTPKTNILGNGHDENRIHLTMLSDRKVGASSAMESVCRNTATPERLRFHIIGPRGEPWKLEDVAPSCARGGADLRLYSLTEMTRRIELQGLSPIWQWNHSAFQSGVFTVHPADWDNSSTHKDPFNLLRFYLPHIVPFRRLKKVLFMDDDVVILKDVAKAWDYKLRGNAVMSASCQNWVWSECDRFTSSTTLSYLEVPYLGFGRIGGGRTVSDAICKHSEDKECMPLGFIELLGNVSVAINGPQHAVTLESLSKMTAWNYGFNLFDLDAWRRLDITDKFMQWMKLNNRLRLFPETSLAYGLGIAMLTKVGHVQCFDEDTPVIQGLGFVGVRDMRGAGLHGETLRVTAWRRGQSLRSQRWRSHSRQTGTLRAFWSR
jgi:lipopolysaccharide biosynthesis glycosyltransferase